MNVSNNKSDSGKNAFGALAYLVIDDFENFRLSMRHMLRSCGAENIELVANARLAVQYCTYNHVDVVLCDYNLGEGKSGQHILEELRYKKLLKRSSLFLMVTSDASREMVMGAREYQPDAYLTKPINHAMLETRLGSLITQRSALLPINREIDRENYPEAISLCIHAIPRQPRYKTWLMKTLAELYFRLGDLTHSIKVYDEVLRQRELSWARLGHSKILLTNHNYAEAIKNLRRLIAAHPDYMEAYDLLAESLERQNKPRQAQDILERATDHSPNALLRQIHLAELAEANQDMDTAVRAWRRSVALGAHSIHDSPAYHLALGNTLCDLSEGDTGTEGAQLASEAFSVLGNMEKRFSDNDSLALRAQIVQCRIYAGQEEAHKAEAVLDKIRPALGNPRALESETGLDYAKTLFRLGYGDEAKTLLNDLATQFFDNPAVLKKIENLLDEPVGFRMKVKARRLNRDGIEAFESGNLQEAAAIFTKALEMIPDHPALNLNQVQVLMKEYELDTANKNLLGLCQHYLSHLAGLPEQHGQYRRYVALQRKLKALTL